MTGFHLETIRPGYTYQALLRVTGRLVLGIGAERKVWAPFLDGTERVDILLDLAGVTQMDAAGVGIIAALCLSMRRRGGTVRLLAASPRVRTLLRVTGVEFALDRPLPPVRECPGRSRVLRAPVVRRQPATLAFEAAGPVMGLR